MSCSSGSQSLQIMVFMICWGTWNRLGKGRGTTGVRVCIRLTYKSRGWGQFLLYTFMSFTHTHFPICIYVLSEEPGSSFTTVHNESHALRRLICCLSLSLFIRIYFLSYLVATPFVHLSDLDGRFKWHWNNKLWWFRFGKAGSLKSSWPFLCWIVFALIIPLCLAASFCEHCVADSGRNKQVFAQQWYIIRYKPLLFEQYVRGLPVADSI